MKYFVRLSGRPPFHGPYDDSEIRSRKKSGELSDAIEVVAATGQTERDLKYGTDWRPWIDSDAPPELQMPIDRKRRHLEEVRATTCYRQLRNLLAGLTITSIVIELFAAIASLSGFAIVLSDRGTPPAFAGPALLAVGICVLELLFTIALYGLLRTVIDLADLQLHRDAGIVQT